MISGEQETMEKSGRRLREHREAEDHRLVGGDLSLDFANTLNGHTLSPGHEYLHDCRDFILWSRHAGILTLSEARLLLNKAAARSSGAERVFQKALKLREVIFRIFSLLAIGSEPDNDDLNLLNTVWREGQRHASLVRSSSGFTLGWDDKPFLERLLRTISVSAIDLLTSQNLRRIRKCAGEHCDWLFIDTSRNHLRRWCSIEECGNRAKMQRRQQRKRLAALK